MELSSDFYEEEEEKTEDKPFHEFSYANIFDMSDVRPGEIEIEDELKIGILWKKYAKKPKKL